MNPETTGRVIASLRKKAGFTQATLAEVLDVSDKAVSKWERGIACPDISLLPKLSILLDTDIESILHGEENTRKQEWRGILVLDELATVQVYSKPLVYFLISNFLLVGIRNILVIGTEAIGIGEEIGLHFDYYKGDIGSALLKHKEYLSASVVMVFGNELIYGAHLTRKFQGLMALEKNASQLATCLGRKIPVAFISKQSWSSHISEVGQWKTVEEMLTSLVPEEKRLARGTVCLPMRNNDEILIAASFVGMMEHSEQIADLHELAKGRGLI